MKLNNLDSRQAFLEQMPTDELDEMLRAELQKEVIDGDLVRLLLRVLEEREREREYPLEDDEMVAAAVEKYISYVDSTRPTTLKRKRRWSTPLKVASILVVVGLLLFVVPQAAHAESIFEMLARWTESVFEFFSPGEVIEQPEYVFETDHPGLQQIYDAVVELGVTEPVVPMWVPKGYELTELKTTTIPHEETVYAVLTRNEKTISVGVSHSDTQSHIKIYKNKASTIEYEYSDTTHYIIQNTNRQIAVWNTGNTVCTVAVDCQEDNLIRILKSIYTSEEIK